MTPRFSLTLAVLLLTSGAFYHSSLAAQNPAVTVPAIPVGNPTPVDLPGLPRVSHLSEKLYNGALPEGEQGFATLKQLGIKTVISVDGMKPDVATARKYGLRYVHLPFGYDGCPVPQANRIARAVRDLPGPIYLHCHHGKHRSPTGSAFARIAVDGLTPEQAAQEMGRLGTGKNYAGLYDAVRSYRRPTPAELDRVPAEFPEVSPTPPLVATMVEIDERFARLQSDSLTPNERAHEALQLRELYAELNRTEAVRKHVPDFQKQLRDAEAQALKLETALRAGQASKARATLQLLAVGCVSCHKQYRDMPKSEKR